MDANRKAIGEKQIEGAIKALEKNNMAGFYVPSREGVLPKIQEFLHDGDTVAVGGSATLSELGVLDFLRGGKYNFLDRYKPGLTPEQVREIFIQSFAADAYLCSSNAVTMDGKLYNVDGNSNRVAAICYGPKSVIMVVGVNKIVPTIEDAITRVKTCAAPCNCARLQIENYCEKTGSCIDLTTARPSIGGGCASKTRICCNYVVSAMQREAGRIKVIFVNEPLGY